MSAQRIAHQLRPDGTRIAFQWSGAANHPRDDLYVMEADGSGVTNLTGSHPLEPNYYPAWSPDGQRIAFIASADAGEAYFPYTS